MKVAALYDIHGNLPALEAVLQEVGELAADQIVVGGDVILGPMSSQCLERLLAMSIPTQFVYGNCEIAVLDQKAGKPPPPLPETVLRDIAWTAGEISTRQEELMALWPKAITLEIGPVGRVLFCHASPRNENENFTKLTSEEKLLPLFENLDVDCVVCGHTHMQFDRTIGEVRVVNAGSIGMPFGRPGAYWLLLDNDIDFRITSYDLQAAAELTRQTSFPGAQNFADTNILNPPTEEAMLAAYGNMELQS